MEANSITLDDRQTIFGRYAPGASATESLATTLPEDVGIESQVLSCDRLEAQVRDVGTLHFIGHRKGVVVRTVGAIIANRFPAFATGLRLSNSDAATAIPQEAPDEPELASRAQLVLPHEPQRRGWVEGMAAAIAARAMVFKSSPLVRDIAGSALESRFRRLAATWRVEREPTSSTTRIAMHPAYQQIIGMGRDVVPLILRELEREPDHWFWALKAITGEDPVHEQHRGRVAAMAHAWIRWGREQGLSW